ncbi:MAG TPA: hypothetical protein VM328_05365, partial [Fimbriimonadaceae bacterium]|nr:hypothetical protein [Fimbriimonadaceae bacterium]
IKVASEQAERGGAAVSFDWKTLAAGAGAVDESSLANLKAVLPPGARAIYPALPPGSLGPQAVNLRLAPSLLGNLLQQGYGAGAAGIAPLASSMATGFMGGKADAMPLGGSLVPGKRPMGDGMGGILGGASDPRGALADAGSGQSKRGNALDFLGLPVRLAPSLGGRSELAEEVAMRSGNLTTPSGDAIRPQQFAPLRDKLFSSFGSVNAEPDKAAWKKEAPAFGLRDEKPTTLLAPDARVKPLKSSEDQPQLDTVEAKGARSLAVTPLENMPKPATGRVDSTEVGPRLGGSAPSMPMYSAEGADSGGFSSIGRIDAPSPSSGVPSLGGVQGAGPIAALTGAASAAAGSLGSLSMPPMPSLSPRSPLSARPSFQPLAVNAASAPAVPGFSGAAPLIGGGAGPTSIGLKPFLPSLVSGAMRSPSGPGAIPSPTAPPPISAPARPGAPIAISKGGNDEMEPLPSMPGSLPSGRGSNSWKMPSLPSPGTPHGPSITHAGSSSSLGAGALSAPSLELPSIGGEMPPTMRKVSSLATRAPDRLFAAPASGRSPARPSLAVQRADQAPQAPSSSTSRQQQTNSQVSAPEDGDKNAQVSLLANEVWAILKRRLVTEKERRGRW